MRNIWYNRPMNLQLSTFRCYDLSPFAIEMQMHMEVDSFCVCFCFDLGGGRGCKKI